MNKDIENKYLWMDLNEMQDILDNESDTLSEEEKSYLQDRIQENKERELKKQENRRKFEIADKQKVEGNVAIVFDLDETLVRRGSYLQNENNEYIGQTDYTLARPGLFELLEGLKKIKQEYETNHSGCTFNIYAFTFGNHINTDEFQNFLGEDYASLFKDFYNRESDIYVTDKGTVVKGIHLLPEDTVLYFGDRDASVMYEYVSIHSRENQRILCFDITQFDGSDFEYAVMFREFNRNLFHRIQEIKQNGQENAESHQTKLDKLSKKLLDYYDQIKNSDKIDILLNNISSQLNGENNDKIEANDKKSALKRIRIKSVEVNQSDIMEEYFELFNEVYGKDQQVFSDIMANVQETLAKYTGKNSFENAEVRARIHPAEVYPHSKRFKNADIGEKKTER